VHRVCGAGGAADRDDRPGGGAVATDFAVCEARGDPAGVFIATQARGQTDETDPMGPLVETGAGGDECGAALGAVAAVS